ncbi:hypothetical protein M9458_053553, partial [Cirrhinus mrigala]
QEITISELSNELAIIKKSKEIFQAQGEWELISIKMTKATLSAITEEFKMDQLIYQ